MGDTAREEERNNLTLSAQVEADLRATAKPLGRVVEPEPAFFGPTGAVKLLRLRLRSRLRTQLKKSFFNCREYLC